jgi:hypothetical protein
MNQIDKQIDTLIDEKLFIPDRKNLEPISDIMGVKLYTSDKLKKDYIDSIKNSKFGNSIGSPIEKLVKSGEIIPCWLNKRLFSLTIFKLFSSSPTKNIAGYYFGDKKKVYIIIDNNINFFTHASDDQIAKITIHETLHMMAFKNSKKFYSIFKKNLIEFYDNYFDDVFELDDKQVDTEEVVDYLIKLQNRPYHTNADIIEYGNIIKETYIGNSKLKKEEFNGVLFNFLSAVKIIVSNPMSFLRTAKKFDLIIGHPLKLSYKITFKQSPPNDNIYFQEIITASEIISVASEMKISSDMINAIKSI